VVRKNCFCDLSALLGFETAGRNYKIGKVGIEASNQIAPLCRLLAKNGHTVSVSHPKKTCYIVEAKIESDRVDSKP